MEELLRGVGSVAKLAAALNVSLASVKRYREGERGMPRSVVERLTDLVERLRNGDQSIESPLIPVSEPSTTLHEHATDCPSTASAVLDA